jgi:hypothetical protein
MLHYAPDGMIWHPQAFGGAEWAAARDCAGLPDASMLLNLLATTREMAKKTPAAACPLRGVFQPEHISGFCAAG